MLKGLDHICVVNDEPIVLTSSVPKYVINLYIDSCYENKFDINNVLPKDFVNFLNFIDKYPTNVLSIDLLENQLIDYIRKFNNLHDHVIDAFIVKYQLKYLYLSLNNNDK